MVVAAGGLVSACEVVPRRRLPEAPPLVLPARLSVRLGGRIVTVPLEEYVLGSIVAEVAPLNETPEVAARIFELQAVLARSYAAGHAGRHRAEGFDLCDSAHCQRYDAARLRSSRLADLARLAVERSSARIVTYGRRPAGTLFHADCGGHTASADAVWGGGAVPYLVPARDALPWSAHREWTRTVSSDDLRGMLNADPRTRVGRRLGGVTVTQRDVSGRAAGILLEGDTSRTIRGEQLRAVVNQRLGEKGLQSTRFTVHRSGASYVFRGSGFGHGVGLCQLGAAARARQGESVEAIIATYFKGAKLERAKI